MSRSRQGSPRLLAVGALLFCLLLVLAIPSKSHAWAWKDQCLADVYNASGDTARMIFWTPIPPVPSNLQLLPVYIAGGVPNGQFGMLTTNTGYPVTWGCHGTLAYNSVLGRVACAYDAPTKGANSFSCTGGPNTLRWQYDDDDIYVHVGIPARPPGDGGVAGPDGSDDPTPARSETRQALRAKLTDDDLPGDWAVSSDLSGAGPIGAAWANGTEPTSCRGDGRDGDTPGHAGSLLRGGDGDFAASAVAEFQTVREANATYDTALSRASADCLAGLLRSGFAAGGGTAETQVSSIDRGDRGAESDGYRIAIDAGDWQGMLDVLGVRKGDQLSMLLFGSTGDAPARRIQASALAAVASRMNGS